VCVCVYRFESGLCVGKPKSGDLNEGIPMVEVRDGVAFPWDPSESFGAACSQPSLLANVSALLAAWRPGAEGGPALFSLLGGDVNPSAKLSVPTYFPQCHASSHNIIGSHIDHLFCFGG